MNDQSKMLDQMTLDFFGESISSLAQASGTSPQNSPDGGIDRCGRAARPASRSRSPAKAPERMIQGICGRTYFGSSASAGLGSLWANKLAERLARLGSTESALIWRESAMPVGPSIFRLAVSTRHTNGTGCTGSPWPTPTVGDSRNMSDAMWPTPTVADIEGGRKTRSGSRGDEMLLNGLMANWITPSARDWKDSPGMSTTGTNPDGSTRERIDMLPRQMAHFGETPTGSNAPTEKPGAPNPVFACWLMGWPEELTSGALRAIQSFRSSRRRPSRRSSTAGSEP